ncbi:MAG: ABC transporter permease [Proteobacteria bacterium]|nr:ABC transporter permease [Pseudomonadota bacterium]
MDFLVVQFLTGLAGACSLFLVAAGLSLIFGVTRVVNFAHGALYMLGAYFAYALIARLGAGPLGFWAGLALAALAVGALGAGLEATLLRRLYGSPELFQLLATFGVALIAEDAVLWLFGPEELVGPRAPGLGGSVRLLGHQLPEYDLFLLALGPAVLGLLWLMLHRTRFGVLVRAATEDRDMVGALGVDQAWLFTAVFAIGAALAGLGGALAIPRSAAHAAMDVEVIVEAFVVVVVGGMGSVLGAFLAAVLIAELHAFGIVLFPDLTLVLVFLVMAVVLVLRPQGLLGRAEGIAREGPAERASLAPPRRGIGPGWAALALLLLGAPLLLGEYHLGVLTEILIFALFAASLHFLVGIGGLVSFGHAAYFGLGAYAAALAAKALGWGLGPALLLAPAAALVGGLVLGWFCVRLSGIYLAMLTLAFAQILFAVAFQWSALTGGDNGILGVWPPAWAAGGARFYYLALALVAAALFLLRRIVFAPFGYALRAARDSALRAEAIGIDVIRWRWLAFALAGGFAGLAGGLYAFFKGSVFPAALGVPISLDGLVMLLLGGVGTLSGPLLGALAYKLLQIGIATATDFWRLYLGLVIVGLVLAFPHGLGGFLAGLGGHRRGAPGRGG